jgi:hypothetical protein
MRTISKVLAAIPLVLLGPQVFGTTMKIDFSGIITNTTDQTGTIFRNGTGDNSGAGIPITGSILWDQTIRAGIFACNPNGGYCISDTDFLGGGSLRPVESAAMHWSVSFAGVEYNSDLNYGARYTVIQNDAQSGAAQDSWNASLYELGHYQLGPEVAGVYDYLYVARSFGLHLADPSGQMIQALDLSTPIDWTAGINGFGTGGLSLLSQIWEDGDNRVFSGTPGALLQNGGLGFVLTSFRSTQVPEPESFALLIAGLVAVFAGRRKLRR